MKNLFVILTNNINSADIDSIMFSWLPMEYYLLLSETTIPEFNSLGVPCDNGVSHDVNHRLYYLFKYHKKLLEGYDWITFLDDSSYVFKKKLDIELSSRCGCTFPRIIGNDILTRSNHFNKNHYWGADVEGMVLNLKTGISINKDFVNKTSIMFNEFKKNEHKEFLRETLLDEMFFHTLSSKLKARVTASVNRVYINTCNDIESNIKDYSILGGLNPLDKAIIMEKLQ